MITRTEAGERDYTLLYLRHGVPEAFKVFFFEYYDELGSFAQLLLQDQAMARRVTIQAFFLFWERRKDFDSAKKIKAFLYLAVRNQCMQQLKTAEPDPVDGIVVDEIPSSLPPELLSELFAFAARNA
jgi:DNA-directed RNA polymerase specialized sigma24 family protein